MKRRSAIKAMLAGAAGLALPSTASGLSFVQRAGQSGQFGWRYDPSSLKAFVQKHRYPYISQQNRLIKGSGSGKKAFLHLVLERLAGQYVPHDQGAPDCVSHAAALAVDALTCVQIAIQKRPQRWAGFAATEPLYGGSRVEIGGFDGVGGGSTGHWLAEWVAEYGILLRQRYGEHDFTYYSAQKAVSYGRRGVPDSLEPIARLHPVKRMAICTSYVDLCDCLYNGCPVMVCSNVGFGSGTCRRDSEGFLTRKRSPWYHAMTFLGYDDEYRRKGALCFNSWGENWVTGPTRGPQPSSTFWVDANTVDSMLRQGDSFAFSGYIGFPRINIPPYIFF
jgi:hypothetical protein